MAYAPIADTCFCQIQRAKEIKTQFVRNVIHENKESRKVAEILSEGTITGVGLIGKDQ